MIYAAHYELFEKAEILHRDISIWNMMLRIDPRLQPLQQELIRQGLLIDLDYAFDHKPSPDVEDAIDSKNKICLLPDDKNNNSYVSLPVLNTPG